VGFAAPYSDNASALICVRVSQSGPESFDPSIWDKFAERIHYFQEISDQADDFLQPNCFF
jgi:hypothetical protein